MASHPPTVQCSHQSLVLMGHLSRIARRRTELALEPTGLRPRHVVALTILRDRGPITQVALGDALRVDPTNLVGLLNELEAESLLERRRDAVDRRRHIVVLSEGGRAALAHAERALASVQDEVLSALDEHERASLYDLLVRATEGQVDCCVAADPVHTACVEADGERC